MVGAGDWPAAPTARLRKIVTAETERVNQELQQREADEAREAEQKIAELQAAIGDTLQAERERLAPGGRGPQGRHPQAA